MAAHGHIPLRQKVLAIRERLPVSRGKPPRKGLTHTQVKVRIRLKEVFAIAFKKRQKDAIHPLVSAVDLRANFRDSRLYARIESVALFGAQGVAECGGRRTSLGSRGTAKGVHGREFHTFAQLLARPRARAPRTRGAAVINHGVREEIMEEIGSTHLSVAAEYGHVAGVVMEGGNPQTAPRSRPPPGPNFLFPSAPPPRASPPP